MFFLTLSKLKYLTESVIIKYTGNLYNQITKALKREALSKIVFIGVFNKASTV